MPEITEVITAGEAQRVALIAKIEELKASAEAHDLQAGADRRALAACRKELADLNKSLDSSRAVKAVEITQAAAEKAKQEAQASKAEADATLARLKEQEAALEAKSKQFDELIAKASTAVAEKPEE